MAEPRGDERGLWVQDLQTSFIEKKHRHSRAGGNLLFLFVPAGQWIPAFAGMTGVWRARFFYKQIFLKRNPQTGIGL